MRFDPEDARNIYDLREMARRRLPRGIFEFLDRGAEDEVAMTHLRQALDAVKFKPRVLQNVGKRKLEVEVLGKTSKMPLAVAPTGAAGLLWYEGEIAVAQAAAAAGIPFTLSASSMTRIEDVASKAGGELWLQVMIFEDREMLLGMIQRAAASGYGTLIVTVDTAMMPNREYMYHNGFAFPFRMNRKNVIDTLTHPSWLIGTLGRYVRTTGMPRFVNFPTREQRSILHGRWGSLPSASADWDDIRRVRDAWKGKLLVKGVIDPVDAIAAAEAGADGVVVSTHGGRNLDSAGATIDALPHVVKAVGDRMTVVVDSGFRRGSDVVKAMALGARTVLVGRAPLYGVAAGGKEGAARAFQILHSEIDRVMAHIGSRDIATLTPDAVYQ